MAGGRTLKLVDDGGDEGAQSPNSRSDFVYDALRDRLRKGLLKPGDRMNAVDIAATLEVSRTPVREALMRMELQGLLTHAPGVGLVVRRLGRQEIVELHAVWRALQGLAARSAAQHATPAEIGAMRAILDRLAQAIADDPEKAPRVGHVFDRMVCDAAHNAYLTQHIELAVDALFLLRSAGTSFRLPGRPQAFLAECRDLVAAIEARDADRAQQAAETHVDNALAARLTLEFTAEVDGP